MELDYTIRRSTRARRVRVAVDAHDGVQVTLPARAREREAALAVAELRPWIERRLAEARAVQAQLAERGSTVPFLGGALQLAPEPGRTRAPRSSAGTGARRAPRWRRASTTRSPRSGSATRA